MKHSVKKTTKIAAVTLAAALVCAVTAGAVTNGDVYDNALNAAKTAGAAVDKALSDAQSAKTDTADAVELLGGTASGGGEASSQEDTQGVSKDETVYVFTNAEGGIEKITVSDKLKNAGGEKTISDYSCLTDITNVKGDETCAENSDGTLTWPAGGNDIYYEGSTDRTLPVQLSVSYKLDGKDVSPEQLAGKSGRVVIRFNYKNDASVTGGETVPFLAITGLVLDNSDFSDISVSNGKIIDDGDRSAVIGFALPGFSDSLGLESGASDFPDYVEVTADTTDFSLASTYTYVSCDFAQSIGTDKIGSVTELTEALDQASAGVTQLTDGTSELYDGLCTLLEKSGEMNTGIGNLYSGATELSTGLSSLDSNSAALQSGAYQVFASLTAQAQAQLNEALTAAGQPAVSLSPENYDSVLGGILDQYTSGAYSQAKAAAEELIRPQVEAAVLEQVTEGVKETVKAAMVEKGYTEEQADAYLSSGDGTATVDAYVQQKMASDEIKQTIESTIDAQIASDEIQSQINAGVDSGLSGNDSYTAIKSLKASLDGYAAFYSGLNAYTAGVSSAASGASQVAGGLGQLEQGGQSLVSGVTQLRDGAMQLSDGVQEFSSEISSKLGGLSESELKNAVPRLNDMLTAAKDYTNYSGIADSMDGTVRFIIKTASIGD